MTYLDQPHTCDIPAITAKVYNRTGNGPDQPIALCYSEADARLFAAAPELLQVLRGCLGYFDYMAAQNSDFTPDKEWQAPIYAAIRKATGLDK